MAGNWVGCRMQTSSQQRAQTAFETALNTGQSQSWRDSTGASGRVDVISTGPASGGGYAEPTPYRDLRFNSGVSRVTRPLEPAAATYVAASRVNLRAASTSAPIVGRLEANQPVSAAGQTGGFVVVHDRGVVRGYVATSVVRPATSGPSYAQANCRTVEQTTTVPGQGTQSARFNACRDSSGQWRVNQV
jgi:surface antigen